MSSFEYHLKEALENISSAGLFRQLRQIDSPQGVHIAVDGQRLLNFSSNDYLGLANHPALCEAAVREVAMFGAGSGASRLISGSLHVHAELEERLAEFKGTQAALTFSSGYSTAIGTLGALLSKNDIIILDKLVHACVVDAARLSGATLRIYRHNDLNDLERILKWADDRTQAGRARPKALIVTESVFSMDGDLAPLQELVRLKNHHGAWLMLDEAHATGVSGRKGAGLARQCDVAEQVEIQMGTLGKALGAAGGYICGSRSLIDLLINRARSFIFSTAPVPAVAGAAIAGITLARSAEGDARREQLWNRVRDLADIINSRDALSTISHSPIQPWIVGDETRAVELADELRAKGIYAPAIRYPSVGRGQARLRFTVSADHTEADLVQLRKTLDEL